MNKMVCDRLGPLARRGRAFAGAGGSFNVRGRVAGQTRGSEAKRKAKKNTDDAPVAAMGFCTAPTPGTVRLSPWAVEAVLPAKGGAFRREVHTAPAWVFKPDKAWQRGVEGGVPCQVGGENRHSDLRKRWLPGCGCTAKKAIQGHVHRVENGTFMANLGTACKQERPRTRPASVAITQTRRDT